MERLQAGISLLVNDRHEGKKKGSSKKHQLILSIGLDALKNDLALSADEQLCIAAELFKGIMQGGKQIKQDEEYLFDVFRKILSRDISLAGWIQYADDIKKYLGITHSVMIFQDSMMRSFVHAQLFLNQDARMRSGMRHIKRYYRKSRDSRPFMPKK